jgi:NAD(P)-dependent dehydrogenase (short-subunit alcohol dehydrogenase family)
MNLNLRGKRALVTGAGRGIGRSIALCLAREGASVSVVSRTLSDIESLVAEMGHEAVGHCGVVMDLALEAAPGQLIDSLSKKSFTPVDIVVHNLGGTLDVRDPFCSLEDWRRVWRLNVEIAIELNLLLVPAMRERRWGRIIHISSISAMENHGPVTYCAVKAALTAYARSLGRVLAPDGIVVTVVLPGAVFTEGGYWDIASRERPDHVQKYLADRMAIHRFGEPDEIGNAVAFLCSDKASFFIGSVVPIDGGQGRSFFGQ